jgi:hypothetical protein
MLVWTRILNSRRRRRRRPRRREKASLIVLIVLREGFGTCDLEGVGGRRIWIIELQPLRLRKLLSRY